MSVSRFLITFELMTCVALPPKKSLESREPRNPKKCSPKDIIACIIGHKE